MARKPEFIELPTSAQLKATGEALMQARASLSNIVRALEGLEGKNVSERALIALAAADAANTLKLFERSSRGEQ